MSDAYSEAISTDDSPAPPAPRGRIPLLGDPATEGNEHLLDELAAGGADTEADDLHDDLNSSDVQN